MPAETPLTNPSSSEGARTMPRYKLSRFSAFLLRRLHARGAVAAGTEIVIGNLQAPYTGCHCRHHEGRPRRSAGCPGAHRACQRRRHLQGHGREQGRYRHRSRHADAQQPEPRRRICHAQRHRDRRQQCLAIRPGDLHRPRRRPTSTRSGRSRTCCDPRSSSSRPKAAAPRASIGSARPIGTRRRSTRSAPEFYGPQRTSTS